MTAPVKIEKPPPFLWEKTKPRSNPRFYFFSRAGHIFFPFHYTIHFWICQILYYVLVFFIRKWHIFGRNLCWIFFLGENLNVEKIFAYHFIPYPKSLRSIPYMGRKAKIFRAVLHLEHTFRTHILLTFRTYIYKLHL